MLLLGTVGRVQSRRLVLVPVVKTQRSPSPWMARSMGMMVKTMSMVTAILSQSMMLAKLDTARCHRGTQV